MVAAARALTLPKYPMMPDHPQVEPRQRVDDVIAVVFAFIGIALCLWAAVVSFE
jgi:hypothetical protein